MVLELNLAFWQNRLAEIQDELTNMVGRPGFSIAGMTTDEAGNFDRLKAMQMEAEGKIEALGAGDANTRNCRVNSTDMGV